MSTQVGPPNNRVDGAAVSSAETTAGKISYSVGVETVPEVSEPQGPHPGPDTQSSRKALNVSGASASAPQHSEVFAQGQISGPKASKHQETYPIDTIDATQTKQGDGTSARTEQHIQKNADKQSEKPEPAEVELPPTPPARPLKQPTEQTSEYSPGQPSGQPPEPPSEHSSEVQPETSISVPKIQIHKPSDASSIMAKALGAGVVKSKSASPMTVAGPTPALNEAVPQTNENTPPSVEAPAAPLPTPAEALLSEVPAVAVSDAAVPAQDVPALAPGVIAGRVKKRKRFVKKVRRAVLRPGILKILLGKENATLVSKQHEEAGTSKPMPSNAPGPLRRSMAL